MKNISKIWIGVVSVVVVVALIQIYGYFRFKSMTHLRIIQKRYPTLIMTEAIASIILLLAALPPWLNSWMVGIPIANQTLDDLLHVIGIVLSVYSLHFIMNIKSLRLWLISFDLHYLNALENDHWKSQIDHSSADKNWYLQNKNKWGNTLYTAKRVFVYYLSASSLSLTMLLYMAFIAVDKRTWIGFAVDGIMYIAPLSTVIYTCYRCRMMKENDHFLFYYEFRITAILWSMGFVSYPVVGVTNYLGYKTVSFSLIIVLVLWCFGFLTLLSTLWIPYKISKLTVWDDYLNDDEKMMTELSKQNSNRVVVGRDKLRLSEQLKETMKSQQEFDAFILYMLREFSAETVLSFIEMVQFKKYISNLVGVEDVDGYVMHDEIPKSSIIYCPTHMQMHSTTSDNLIHAKAVAVTVNTNIDNTRIKNILHSIHEKYIRINSQFEINLGSPLRQKYKKFDEQNWDMDSNDFVHVFDALIEKMFDFMKDSYARYAQN
eukprot:165906_1